MALLTLLYLSVSTLFSIIAFNIQPKHRPVLLVFIVLSAWLSFQSITSEDFSLMGPDTVAIFVLIYISHVSYALCLEKYELPNGSWDWRGGLKMTYNARWIGTTLQAPDVHRSSSQQVLDVQRRCRLAPSSNSKSHRRTFICTRIGSLFSIYALNQVHKSLFGWYLQHLEQPLGRSDFHPSKESYLRRLLEVTQRETAIRIWLVLFFVGYAYGVYTFWHDILALIFVGIGLDCPDEWPPVFGDPLEAYSLRRFWGKFWHRGAYRSYTGYGKLVSRKILRLSHTSQIGRLFVNFLVFLMSGVVHALAIRQAGYTCGYWEEIAWYCLNFMGILVEMAVQHAISSFWPPRKDSGVLDKACGFIWVFAFLFWSLPKSQFAKMNCLPGLTV